MGRKVARKSKHTEIDDFPQDVQPQKRKRWSMHDLKNIKALNPRQEEFLRAWFDGNNIVAHGTAGTGKTLLSVYAALSSLLDPSDPIQRIIVVRSAVPGRQIGHLPGTIEEKQQVYEIPYIEAFADLLGRPSSYADMKEAGKVEFVLTSFVRSLTWHNAAIILDEVQNMTWDEIDSVATRLGQHSRIIMAGDTHHQRDLPKHEKSGIDNVVQLASTMSSFCVVEYTRADIVRSGFVKEWVEAREDLNL